jgi:integrase/recombinase XerD
MEGYRTDVGSQMFSADFSLDDVTVAADRKVDRNGKARVLDQAELEQLFGAMESSRDRALFAICFFCGARISEVLALDVPDIGEGLITFKASTTKTGESRQARIVPQLQAMLDDYLVEDKGAVFPGRHGRGKLTRRGADSILRDACQRIGLEGVSTHSFRRSFVTQLVKSGKTPHQIRQLTGHKSMGSLLEYFGG